jgi:hypothetical protein
VATFLQNRFCLRAKPRAFVAGQRPQQNERAVPDEGPAFLFALDPTTVSLLRCARAVCLRGFLWRFLRSSLAGVA